MKKKIIQEAKVQPLLVDANILMVGIDKQYSDPNYRLEKMQEIYLNSLFAYFEEIKIHEMVYHESDHGLPFLSTRDGIVSQIIAEIPDLHHIDIIGFEYLLAIGFFHCEDPSGLSKVYSSLYKSQCTPSIIKGKIPKTFNKFLASLG